jgi:hypothetical protein
MSQSVVLQVPLQLHLILFFSFPVPPYLGWFPSIVRVRAGKNIPDLKGMKKREDGGKLYLARDILKNSGGIWVS